MSSRRSAVLVLSFILVSAAFAGPAVAEPLPSGKTVWVTVNDPTPTPLVVRRSGDQVKLARAGFKDRGTVSGNTLHLTENGDFTFQYKGRRILKLKPADAPEWQLILKALPKREWRIWLPAHSSAGTSSSHSAATT